MRRLTVYIAASSRALDLADSYRKRLVAEGIRCTSDWIDDVRAERDKGRSDADLSEAEARLYAEKDLACIAESDVVWLIASDHPSVGMWVELGVAIGRRIYAADSAPLRLVVSGLWKSRIFTRLADACFDDHEDAFAWVTEKRGTGP